MGYCNSIFFAYLLIVFCVSYVLQVMMDKIYLLNSWPFLVKHLKTIVEDIQTKAKTVYGDEETKSPVRLVPNG